MKLVELTMQRVKRENSKDATDDEVVTVELFEAQA